MHYIVAIALLLQVSMGLEQRNNVPAIVAPGRADRMFEKRAGPNFGKQTISCVGGEGACNNACYYINCIVSTCQLNHSQLELTHVCGRLRVPIHQSKIQTGSCTSDPEATVARTTRTDKPPAALLEAIAHVVNSHSVRSSATKQQVRLNTNVMSGHLHCPSNTHLAIRTDWHRTVYAACQVARTDPSVASWVLL